MKDFYEHYWQKRGSSGPRPRYKIFEGWIDKGSSVFEVGCGDGYFGQYLIENKKVSYTGIDISEKAIQLARERGLSVSVIDVDGNKDFFSGKNYDYVVVSEVIEHLINAEQFLESCLPVVRRGVLVSIPNIAYWRFRLQLLTGNFPKQWAVAPQEHLRYWSVDDFVKTTESVGYRVREIRASNGKKILRNIWPNLFGFQVCFFLEPRSLTT